MSHKKINTLHPTNTAFLLFISSSVAMSPITLFVCPSISSLIILLGEQVEFGASDIRTEVTID